MTPTREEKISAIEQVVYEYANLMAAAFYAMQGQAPWRTHADDAFLLGYQKLGDFLLNDPLQRQKDEVLAMDYLPDGITRSWSLATWTQVWRTPMNKQLTHIAYERVQQRKWNHVKWVPDLKMEFRDAWETFRAAVTDPDFRAEYDKQIALCRAKPGSRTSLCGGKAVQRNGAGESNFSLVRRSPRRESEYGTDPRRRVE